MSQYAHADALAKLPICAAANCTEPANGIHHEGRTFCPKDGKRILLGEPVLLKSPLVSA